MPRIIPIRDLKDTTAISQMCSESDEPVYITKNGYGDLVVMSIEAYEKLVRDIQVDAAILEAEKEVREGAELMDAREALVGLRRKQGA